jgi:uncharacterized protein
MPLRVNLRHLAGHNVVLQGELSPDELDLETHDDMIRVSGPVAHELEAQLLGEEMLVRGRLQVALACQCVRCLKPFVRELVLTEWTCLLPLTGEERVAVDGDYVDLTPQIREDILLAFPQHPVCDAQCRGLAGAGAEKMTTAGPARRTPGASAWAALDKLKL